MISVEWWKESRRMARKELKSQRQQRRLQRSRYQPKNLESGWQRCQLEIRLHSRPKKPLVMNRREEGHSLAILWWIVEKRATAWQFWYVLNALGSASFDITGWTAQKITSLKNCFSCGSKVSMRKAHHLNFASLAQHWSGFQLLEGMSNQYESCSSAERHCNTTSLSKQFKMWSW